jgi:hypothetical protein
MKTKAILAAAATAFLLTSTPTLAADTQVPETKRCYRTLHKVPYRVRVRCPKPKVPTPSAPTQPEPAQKPPAQQQTP